MEVENAICDENFWIAELIWTKKKKECNTAFNRRCRGFKILIFVASRVYIAIFAVSTKEGRWSWKCLLEKLVENLSIVLRSLAGIQEKNLGRKVPGKKVPEKMIPRKSLRGHSSSGARKKAIFINFFRGCYYNYWYKTCWA